MWRIRKQTKKNKIRNFIIDVGVLITIPVVINLIFFGGAEQLHSVKDFIHYNAYGFTLGVSFWFGNSMISIYIGRKFNWRKNPVRANLYSMLSYIIFGLTVSLTAPYIYLKYIIHVPDEYLRGNVISHAFTCISIDIIIISIFYSNYIVNYLYESVKNEKRLEHENLIARYEALKNQVNPHFLFNSLNTLTGVVEQYPEKASGFIRKLSDIYRYVLEQKDKELIPLEEELKFVEDYIYLLKMRYGEGLKVENNIDKDKLMIIPLGLQILIENAIKHNIISDDKPLTVQMGNKKDYIYVKNNLQRKSSVPDTNGVGLENLIKRYEYIADQPVTIVETKSEFEVKLPLVKN